MQKTSGLSGIFLLGFILFLLGSGAAWAADETSCLITGSGVRVRAEPKVSAKEVTRLSLGAVVTELDKTADQQTIGSATAPWFKVKIPGGQEGWVFGGFAFEFTGADKSSAVLKLAEKKVANEDLGFGEAFDLFSWVDKMAREEATDEGKGNVECARLKLLKRALESIPIGKKDEPPYSTFIKSQEPSIVFSEPAGSYFVRSELFWAAAEKYEKLPVGDDLAWAGAQNPLPGETEGYLPAVLGCTQLMQGKYLETFPAGKHASEAAQVIIDILGDVLNQLPAKNNPYYLTKEDTDSFLKDLAKFRAVCEKMESDKKARVLEILDGLKAGCPLALKAGETR